MANENLNKIYEAEDKAQKIRQAAIEKTRTITAAAQKKSEELLDKNDSDILEAKKRLKEQTEEKAVKYASEKRKEAKAAAENVREAVKNNIDEAVSFIVREILS